MATSWPAAFSAFSVFVNGWGGGGHIPLPLDTHVMRLRSPTICYLSSPSSSAIIVPRRGIWDLKFAREGDLALDGDDDDEDLIEYA